jgi:hypothetical protein
MLPMLNAEDVLKKGCEWVELVAREKGWGEKALKRRKEVRPPQRTAVHTHTRCTRARLCKCRGAVTRVSRVPLSTATSALAVGV